MGEGPVLHVASVYIEMGATPDRPAAGYFTIEGGPRDVDLVAVTSDLAQRVEMHESVRENGVMTMKSATRAPVPENATLDFTPGDRPLLYWKLTGSAGAAVKSTIRLERKDYS